MPKQSQTGARERFECAIRRFDEENAQDPNRESEGNGELPRELLYSKRLTDWVFKLDPAASEPLRLAARCQHLCRWKIPRSNYPLDRAGYHKWRNALRQLHADLAGRILAECGYDLATINQVRALNLKQNFPADPDSQTLEDALCLVFLEFQFADLAGKTEEKKMVNALRKSWSKMSANAREKALTLGYSAAQKLLLEQALAS